MEAKKFLINRSLFTAKIRFCFKNNKTFWVYTNIFEKMLDYFIMN